MAPVGTFFEIKRGFLDMLYVLYVSYISEKKTKVQIKRNPIRLASLLNGISIHSFAKVKDTFLLFVKFFNAKEIQGGR